MSRYIQDPNDSTKQIPGALPDNAYDSVNNPDRFVHTKTPSYILVNKELTLDVGFHFGGTSASLSTAGNTTITNYTTMLSDGAVAGTKINIHPNAWSGSAADAGSITFVYKSGLATGGF